jgi:ABC-type Na+ transport system ATPase subunit NatA
MREEVMRGWRKLHNEELYDIFSSMNVDEIEDGMGGVFVMLRGEKSIHSFGEKQLEKRWRRWRNNIESVSYDRPIGGLSWE